VLDASHPSEHEARAETGPLTPLAAPAVQLGPLDLLRSGQQLVVDLSESNWRDALEFAGGETQVVYVLRSVETDIDVANVEVGENLFEKQLVEQEVTNEYMKVGKTTAKKIFGRFEKYATAGRKWGRHLKAEIWTFKKRAAKSAEMFEKEIREGFEARGERLRWDNTNRRLGRTGQGIPEPKPLPEDEFELIDEVEKDLGKQPISGGAATEETAEKAAQSAEKTKAEVKAPSAAEEPPAPSAATEAGGEATQQAGEKVTTEAAGATKTVAAEVTDEATALAAKQSAQVAAEAAAGTLTAGLAGTAMEVLSNPALGFGYMVLEGISGDYHAAWDAIKAPARVRGFAQGMAARFAGLDGHAALMMITPDYVNKANIGADIVGGEGMEEQALVDGAREGWKYANGYSVERRKRELDRAAARLKAQGGPELEYDVDGQLMRQSLRNVGEMFLPQARNAIAKWDALREERERKEKARQLRELAKYDPISGGQLRAVANALDPEPE
jgi:hypothetical protein